MIQRIQSVYLTIVCILIFLMFFIPQAIFIDESGNLYHLIYEGLVKYVQKGHLRIEQNILNTAIIVSTLIMSMVCIFLFKNRKNQIKACWILIILLFLQGGYIFYTYKSEQLHYAFTRSSLSWASIIPIVSIVLTYLAILAIRKDNRLIKSVDRIR